MRPMRKSVLLRPIEVSLLDKNVKEVKKTKKVKKRKSKRKSYREKLDDKVDTFSSRCNTVEDSNDDRPSSSSDRVDNNSCHDYRQNEKVDKVVPLDRSTSPRPNNPRQLLRKLSSFVRGENTDSNQNSPNRFKNIGMIGNGDEQKLQAAGSGKARQLLRKLSSFKESSTTGEIPVVDSKSRKLLRKLSSFTEEEAKKEQSIDSANVYKNDVERKDTEVIDYESRFSRGRITSFFANLKRRRFAGNPTQSFAEEEGFEENSEMPVSHRKSIVKVYHKDKSDRIKEDENENEEETKRVAEAAAIEEILRQQEEAEREDIKRRIATENSKKERRKAQGNWGNPRSVVRNLNEFRLSTRESQKNLYTNNSSCDSDDSSVESESSEEDDLRTDRADFFLLANKKE